MSCVIFLRGVNVGGKKTFSPAALARSLNDLDVVNIGAAGTFVVRRAIGQNALRARLEGLLSVDAEIVVCAARELLALVNNDPFEDGRDDVTCYVSVLSRAVTSPQLPILVPDAKDWQVKVFAARGRFILSLHRRSDKRLIYPNEVIEKHFKAFATTRNWNTFLKIAAILRSS